MRVSTKPEVLALLFVSLSTVGCHGIVRESYYTMSAEGGTMIPASIHTTYEGPSFSIPSDCERFSLHAEVLDYSTYDVAAGPLPYVWVLPYFLFSWIWHDPLPRDTMKMMVNVDGAEEDDLELRVDGLRLRNEGGDWVSPSSHYWTGGSEVELHFDLPEGLDESLELEPGGIYAEGVQVDFPIIHLRRTKGWKVFMAG